MPQLIGNKTLLKFVIIFAFTLVIIFFFRNSTIDDLSSQFRSLLPSTAESIEENGYIAHQDEFLYSLRAEISFDEFNKYIRNFDLISEVDKYNVKVYKNDIKKDSFSLEVFYLEGRIYLKCWRE